MLFSDFLSSGQCCSSGSGSSCCCCRCDGEGRREHQLSVHYPLTESGIVAVGHPLQHGMGYPEPKGQGVTFPHLCHQPPLGAVHSSGQLRSSLPKMCLLNFSFLGEVKTLIYFPSFLPDPPKTVLMRWACVPGGRGVLQCQTVGWRLRETSQQLDTIIGSFIKLKKKKTKKNFLFFLVYQEISN